MLPGARLAAWIADKAFGWKLPVGEWVASWLGKGATLFAEDSEKVTQELMRATLTRISKYPSLQPEIKKALEDALTKADWQKTVSG